VSKRSVGWLIVAILASSLITSCSSAGNKDCKILFEAKESLILEPKWSDYVERSYTLDSMDDYYSTLQENQLVFGEPKVREHVLDYINEVDNVVFKQPDFAIPISWSIETKSFVKRIDNYCNSL